MQHEVMKSNLYGDTSSLGDAAYKLVDQHNFPNVFDSETDDLLSADHDRMMQWDLAHFRQCCQDYVGSGECAIPQWVSCNKPKRVVQFLKALFKVEEQKDRYAGLKWVGYRVMVTVNRSNGYQVYSLELFGKRPGSKTKLYSGPHATNVNMPMPKMPRTCGVGLHDGSMCIGFADGSSIFWRPPS